MVKEGDRIRLVHTSDQHTELKPGAEGDVVGINKLDASISPEGRPETQIDVDWDSGSSLMLVDSQDSYEVIDSA